MSTWLRCLGALNPSCLVNILKKKMFRLEISPNKPKRLVVTKSSKIDGNGRWAEIFEKPSFVRPTFSEGANVFPNVSNSLLLVFVNIRLFLSF